MKNARVIFITVLVIIMSALGTMVSQHAIAKPPEEAHMKQLQAVAEEAIDVGYRYEVPEGFELSFNDGTMVVRSSDFAECGVVKCAPKANGDTAFVFERETVKTTGVAIVVAIFSGMLTSVCSVCLIEKVVKKK